MAKLGPGVLIMCTGNSCRSQMAEGYLRELGGDRFDVYSAGTEPAMAISAFACQVMLEDGVDIADQRPTDYRAYLGTPSIRYVILVCDGAAQTCPTWPGPAERLVWPFEDPAMFRGSDAAKLEKFREIRDQIKARLVEWLEAIGSETPKTSHLGDSS